MRKTNNLNTPFEVIGRELDSVNEFITDLPLVRASNIEYDEGAFIEPWRKDAHSDLSDFQSPYFSHDFDVYGRKDYTFLRKSAIAMKRNDFRKNPAEMEKYRMQMTRLTIGDIMRDISDDFVHGSPKKDFRHAIGLEARFDRLTDMEGKILAGTDAGKINPYITLDAGGGAGTAGIGIAAQPEAVAIGLSLRLQRPTLALPCHLLQAPARLPLGRAAVRHFCAYGRHAHESCPGSGRKEPLQGGVCDLWWRGALQCRCLYPRMPFPPAALLCRRGARCRCHHRWLQPAGGMDHGICGGGTSAVDNRQIRC